MRVLSLFLTVIGITACAPSGECELLSETTPLSHCVEIVDKTDSVLVYTMDFHPSSYEDQLNSGDVVSITETTLVPGEGEFSYLPIFPDSELHWACVPKRVVEDEQVVLWLSADSVRSTESLPRGGTASEQVLHICIGPKQEADI